MLVAITGCGSQESPHTEEQPPATVSVFSAAPSTLEITEQLPGRVRAIRTAEVRARVSGIVKKRLFTEGMNVKEGQVLFQIDAAPFEAALDRANADVQRTEAAAAEAKSTLDRYTPLAKIEAVSQQDLVTAQTAYKTALANVAAAKADAKTSRLSLEYATVRAPIAGRIGRSLVTEGALVGQGEATALATIQQIDQVYVDVTQPVADAMRLREAVEAGALQAGGGRVVATVDGTQKQREGKLLFSDISVDPTSGQVTLRGMFPNQDALLLPGMFVRVAVSKGVSSEAILVPQRAVRVDADGGSHLWVVNKDAVIEDREVGTGGMYGAQWHILHGLSAGEQVVVGGQAVEAGQKVHVAMDAGADKKK
ncbi:multidrug efflux system membrane fusion protein [Comamonas sp. JUb58]|nr:multidrug efflux system membrane fusion protein [Comamonas sp. JUb58]